MKSVKEMSEKEQDDVLSLASKIQSERAKSDKFKSLSDARTVMIRWDVPYGKYKQSYHSIFVDVDEVRELVESKIFGETQ